MEWSPCINITFAQTRRVLISSFCPSGEYGAQHTDYVLVPSNKCGLVIGKGGETIKQVGMI